MFKKLQSSSMNSGRGRGVDIEVLLQGAEKLSAVHQVPGVVERIATIRAKHARLSGSIKRYECEVSQQQALLNDSDSNVSSSAPKKQDFTDQGMFTPEDIQQQEAILQQLELKKLALEAHLAEMERDLGDLKR